jgi:omega-6 fatty acid desaturase (delta-12 desaturase)
MRRRETVLPGAQGWMGMDNTQRDAEPAGEPGQASELPEHSADIRLGRELLRATVPFATEFVRQSWWQVLSTFSLLVLALIGAGLAPGWPLRTAFSILGALLMVRSFITYHDYMHGAILRHSRVARVLFQVYAAFALTPSASWRKSHNYHHGHVGQIEGSGIGSFPVMTTRMWRAATPAQRARYRVERHPLTVLFGYVTIFLLNICVLPLASDPSRHWDSALSLVAHFG